MRAYSRDHAAHLMQAIQPGLSKAEAVRSFGVRVRTVDRYLKELAETGC